ncbi:MAG TPA: NAD(P)/FAD-dependent oxidoreductase [Planctomycetaceae bacterium]|nr:NAD(P)/FAD-dependent oxidoreductase [Planctomycetaceae bacterium]
MAERTPTVVIVGGGFGGLAAAKALRRSPARVVLIDRTNHHVFQPLLYQVATSTLSPQQIGSPLRAILGRNANTTVLMGEVTGIDCERRCVIGNNLDRQQVPIPFDYLIVAAGVRHSYFGHDEFEKHAPGLKTLADAVAMRNKILGAFEQAEAEEDPNRHQDLLTFVIVGGGPTGVEMAGAIAVLVHKTLPAEFRRIDPKSARIVLVDRGPRVVGGLAESLSNAAKAQLEKLGVEVRLGTSVDLVDEHGVIASGERIKTKTVIWAAGVAASPAGKWLQTPTDHAGRVRVANDLSVPGRPDIFVIGDTASLDEEGKPLPGVAQVAIQQGRYVGKLIHRRIVGKPAPRPFRYFDKGSMAVVGKGFAVLESRKVRLHGFLAWLAWAAVHIEFLGQSNLRVSVFVQWVWTYLTGTRGSQIIVEDSAASGAEPAAGLRSESAVDPLALLAARHST